MSESWPGEDYQPSDIEKQIVERVAAAHAGQNPSAIWEALSTEWQLTMDRGATPDVTDWFKRVVPEIVKLPKPEAGGHRQ